MNREELAAAADAAQRALTKHDAAEKERLRDDRFSRWAFVLDDVAPTEWYACPLEALYAGPRIERPCPRSREQAPVIACHHRDDDGRSYRTEPTRALRALVFAVASDVHSGVDADCADVGAYLSTRLSHLAPRAQVAAGGLLRALRASEAATLHEAAEARIWYGSGGRNGAGGWEGAEGRYTDGPPPSAAVISAEITRRCRAVEAAYQAALPYPIEARETVAAALAAGGRRVDYVRWLTALLLADLR
jgi:hypothetical protein